MKILIFSVAYHPFVGGAEVAVKEITDRIPDAEFHLVTVNLDGKQQAFEKIGNVFVYRIGSGTLGKYLFPISGALKGLSLHRMHGFNATWSIMAAFAGFAALFFKFIKPRVPFVLTLQEGDPISYIKRQVWFVYPLFMQIFRRADRIQTISNYLAGFAKSMVRQDSRVTIEVIPNGVDVSLFSQQYPGAELEVLKNELGKKDGDIFLVTASRLVLKNGVGDVIAALPLLPERVKFLILGTGPLETKLKKLAHDIRVTNRVIFRGFVPHKELPKYLKISDIFIRPSLSEGMGNSFIEAMAAEVPVIATPVGGIPDFLFPDQTGVFCEPKNSTSVAESVNKILNDETLKKGLISNAKKLVAEKYGWDLVAKNMREKIFLFSEASQ